MMRRDADLTYVFVHGAGQASWVWDPVIDAMRAQAADRRLRTLALDVPGCGAKRDRDTAALTLKDVIDELASEVAAAGLSDPILVGHSMAGTVLASIAQANPGLFQRIVYVACCAPDLGQSVKDLMGLARHGEDPSSVGWPVDIATASPEAFRRAMYCNDMSDQEHDDFVARLGKDQWPPACRLYPRDWAYSAAGPATYVVALQDQSLPPPWQLRFAERVGAERLVRIDGGHQLMQTRPQALAESLLREAAFHASPANDR